MIQVEKMYANSIIPEYAHGDDAGADLFSVEDIIVKAKDRAIIPTGIKIKLEPNTEAQIRSKSGLAANKGIMVLNSPGTIDCGYTGEIQVILFNTSDEDYFVKAGSKVAQMVVKPVIQEVFVEVEKVKRELGDLGKPARGAGKFGSTGLEKK